MPGGEGGRRRCDPLMREQRRTWRARPAAQVFAGSQRLAQAVRRSGIGRVMMRRKLLPAHDESTTIPLLHRGGNRRWCPPSGQIRRAASSWEVAASGVHCREVGGAAEGDFRHGRLYAVALADLRVGSCVQEHRRPWRLTGAYDTAPAAGAQRRWGQTAAG